MVGGLDDVHVVLEGLAVESRALADAAGHLDVRPEIELRVTGERPKTKSTSGLVT
jgi:hypothetical protein